MSFESNAGSYEWQRKIWTLNASDTGDTEAAPLSMSTASAQVIGTFGGATVLLEISNDGENWVTMKNIAGEPVSLTSPGLHEIASAAAYVRARVSGGNGTTSITVILIVWN